jgi:hypothetical protein
MMSLIERRVRDGSFDGQSQPQGAGLAARARRVELEYRAVREDGGVVGRAVPCCSAVKTSPRAV